MQSPPVLVTSRRIQNVHTGLDLTVPQHQEVRGKMMSGHVEYQILVVTRLAAFKLAKHRPEDVVQFLVSKKYSDIEEFYQKLSGSYPSASLPPLPRKILFVGESDIRERRAAFNEILRCVAKDAELAGSPELLEFLGTRSPGSADLTSRDVSVLDTDSQAGDTGEAFDFFQQQEEVEGPPTPGQKNEDAEKSSEEEEALDPLGILRVRPQVQGNVLSTLCASLKSSRQLRKARLQGLLQKGAGEKSGGVQCNETAGTVSRVAPGTEDVIDDEEVTDFTDGTKVFRFPCLSHPSTLSPPSSKKPKKRPEVAVKPRPRPSPRLTIFDEEADPDEGLFRPSSKLSSRSHTEDTSPRDPLKLFDDPDLGGTVALGDPLLLPAACESGGPTARLGHREAPEDLFRVEEDLDQILNLGAETKPQPQPKHKPPVAAKPALPRKPAVPPRAGPREAVARQQRQQQIQAMDEMDILQYIQDHDTPGQATPSLF